MTEAQSEILETVNSVRDRAAFDALLRITPDLETSASCMRKAGDSVSDIIWHLQRSGVTKPGVRTILVRVGIVSFADAKETVHLHPAFEYRREADERFQEEVIEGCEQIEELEKQAAA